MPYSTFFAASVSAAGALVGLLFVALSLTPEQRARSMSAAEHQAVAATAFTALVDALFVALAALVPGNTLTVTAIALGLLGLTSTAGLVRRLWRARSHIRLNRRWLYLLGLIVATYAAQAGTALLASTPGQARALAARFLFIFFAIGIARSWELLGLRGGGVLDLLGARLDAHRAGPRKSARAHTEQANAAQADAAEADAAEADAAQADAAEAGDQRPASP